MSEEKINFDELKPYVQKALNWLSKEEFMQLCEWMEDESFRKSQGFKMFYGKLKKKAENFQSK